MAKNKKNIENFQQALSSNTEFLNEDKFEDEVLFGSEKTSDFVIPVDRMIFRQFKILAIYQKKDIREIINEALNHYLRLKKMHIEEAMRELTKEK
ncbi:MAG: hypothetical protein A2X13_14205 [Bacteroidetes bacterium GWC2_33_15]|nr:MAG: hypothetical protein A2X10_12250 [Bacteroidetes bacterium GWA2_33_15]OFX50028.1 MAG: hypothetical protein A2X13_14205 [Bacteroidetes bacterium GWC2_33_15]OFX65182.1 MAG: hypothetical protein A2X15_03780 [Bacteroidetes bacterium GWB2_32_14]OFX70407.1 MAG: hypothetical protein A2X14_03835 [Bacteroidetes bacterium GWD2_33_33]HAN19725.1 hypothetical protein [Bacteroidales bacterium]